MRTFNEPTLTRETKDFDRYQKEERNRMMNKDNQRFENKQI